MKTSDDKKSNKKFDLEKMKVATLKDLHLINGGDVLGDDPKTVTDLGKTGNGAGGQTL
ncbi:hypothetical protein [Flavobacterium hiemivividum]|uniref:hypothetical protein n=1 Tax=Flavobacterium hiemivividum TaxID=2541734 RepID=UPI00140475B8|nr:hypothetical protein [Flavobacterium hiemivividum]